MTVTRKNENSRNIVLDIPFYITTNLLPRFRHEGSVMTRLKKFDTVSLPSSMMEIGVAGYFEKNAMMHLHWIGKQIDLHRALIPVDELFYEAGHHTEVSEVDQARKKELRRLRDIRLYAGTPGLHLAIESGEVHEVSELWYFKFGGFECLPL